MQKFLRTLTLMAFLVVPWVTQAQVSLPYSYGFEDNDLTLDGWLLQNASTSSGISTAAVQTGSYGFAFIYSEQNGATLVSPLLTGGDNGVSVAFSYKEYSNSYGDEQFQVGYTTDATVTDPNSFTYGDVITASLSWQQYVNSFPAGTKRIAIKYIYNDAYYLYLDDFTFEALSTCPNPVGLALSEIGPNSAKLAWTERGTATSWRICLNGDETNLITANTNPFTLTGLTAETPYTVKVRAYCTATDQSDWSTVESFTTTSACPVPYDIAASNVAAHTATLGWTGFSNSYNVRYRVFNGLVEGFESGSLPDGWIANLSSGSSGVKTGGPEHTGNYGFVFNYSEQNASLISPLLTNTENGATLSFYYKEYSSTYGDEQFYVGYTTDATVTDPADFTYGDITTASLEWQLYQLSLPAGTKRFAIKYVYNDAYYLFIDDITVEGPTPNPWTTVTATSTSLPISGLVASSLYEYQVQGVCGSVQTDWSALAQFTTSIACPIPTNFTYSNLTAHGFTLNWVAGGQETSWILTIGENTYTVTGDPTYTATGLQGETEYHVTLKADCGTTDGYSSEIGGYLTTDIACPAPSSLAAGTLTTTSAELSWTENGEAAWQICVNGDEDNPVTANSNPFTLSGLTENTEYTVKVRANCGGVDGVSQWSNEVTFTTIANCVAPTDATASNITAHGATISWTSDGNNFIIMMGEEDMAVNAGFENNGLNELGNYTNDATYPWEVTGTSVNGGSFSMKSGNGGVSSSTSSISVTVTFTSAGTISFAARCSCEQTDPSYDWDYGTFYIDGVQQGDKFINSTEFSTHTYAVEAGEHTFMWKYKKDGSVNNNDDCFYIDDVVISSGVSTWDNSRTATASPYTLTGLDAETSYQVKVINVCASGNSDPSEAAAFTTAIACQAPTALTAGEVTTSTVELSWTENGSATAWQLCLNGDEENLIAANSNPFTLTGLAEYTEYTIKVRANCGGIDGVSQWSNVADFQTLAGCPAPEFAAAGITNVTAHTADVAWTGHENDSYDVSYRTAAYFDGESEAFATSSIPTGWTRYTGLVDNVLNGTATLATTTSGWVFSSTYVFGAYHSKINIYGSNARYWLVTPETTVGDGYGLSFDLALSDYGNANPIENIGNQADDRFVVLITTDNMATWTILREWNNSGSAYVYDNIATAGENVTIDLAAYAGQNVKVAFYGESTASGGDNDLHIDNVGIGQMVAAGAWQTVNTTATSTNLTGLAGETVYDVKVVAHCGSNVSDESATLQFTTDIACPAPTALTAGIPTPNSVELSWTENGTATAWQLCINGDEDHLVAANSNPFDLTGLTASTDYTVKVRANCGGIDGQSDWSNTVSFTTQADCPVPVLVANGISNVTAHTADIDWTGFTQNDSYNVFYRSQEYVDGISEEFATTTIPEGWTRYTGLLSNIMSGTALTSATSGWTFGTGNNVFNSHARVNIYGNYQRWLVTPNIAVGDNFGFNFDMALTVYTSTSSASPTPGNQPDDKFVVLISTDNMTTWSILRQWDNEGSPYVYDEIPNTGENVSIDLSAYAGQNVKIAFYGESTVSNGDNNLHIDNVTIGVTIPAGAWQTVSTNTASTTLTGLAAETPHEVKIQGVCGGEPTEEMSDVQVFTTLPSCMMVEGLAINPDLTTSSSLTITWNDNYNNGATYTIYMNGVVAAPAVTGNSYTATDLESNSPYSFAVVANCGDVDGLSAMTATVTGRTNCDALTLPHTFTFEADELITTSNSAATPALPWCSYRYVTPEATSYTTYPYSYTSNPHDGSRALYFYGTTVTAAPAQMAWITPQVDVTTFPMNGNRVTFWARMANTTYNKDVIVGTMSDPTDFSTFNEAGSVTVSGTTHTEYAVNLNSAYATDAYVAVVVNKGSGHLYMDDVTLELIPSCLAVTDLTASDVTTTGAVLTWADNDNDNATYTVKNGNVVVESGITATTYTLTGLTPNTTYTFAVVANCAVDAEPVEVNVTTLQVPATLPYTTGFETGDDNNQWTLVNGTNGWYFGEAASNGGTNGLYISNDGGVSNAYTNSASTASYAYRTIDFAEAGYYSFAFDWKAYGESTWDYIRVALVPTDATLPAYNHNYYQSLPEGWIAVDGGYKNLNSTEWNSVKNTIELTAAGQYNLVIAWMNDGSGGTNPPAAIDNIVVKAKSAFEPQNLTAENISATGATLTWTANPLNNGTETYTLYNNNVEVATGITGNNYTATLTANTDYNFTLVAVNGGDNSDAVALGLGVYEYPTQAGKMVYLGGTILNTVGNTSTMTLYRGLGDNLTEQANYTEGTYLTEALTSYTASNEWPVYGPMTVIYMGETATSANTGVAALTPGYKCPMVVSRDAVEETANGAYTWTTPEGTVYNYENHRDAALALNENGDIVATYYDTVRNAGDCDSIINTLQLTLHPDFTIALTDEFCEGTTYVVGEGTADEVSFTASAQQNVLLHTVNGADSVIVLDLQMNPAPAAYINNKASDVVNNFCDEFDLVLNARSNMEGVTFEWEDASTEATRTVNPHESNTYTLIAIDPNTGCQSITPATLTVNTTAVPVLTVSATAEEVCYGQSTTLTVSDANNVEATYRWSNNQTGSSITVTPSATTTYTVTATSTTGNCVVTAEKEIVVNALPVVEVSTDVAALCANSTLTLNATAVEGYSYEWNTGAATAVATTNPTVSGNYTVTVTDQNGCVNEFTTANVTVYPVYELNDAQSVCFTQNPYTWGTQTITENGSYDQTFQTVNGCDSLVHLTFTFEQMGVENSYREVCQNTDVTWGETTYTSVQESATLSYVDNSGDCPVQYNLVLIVNPVVATSFDHVACDSYAWTVSGETYTVSGAYPYTLATTKGCDSVVTMNLTVNYQNTGIDEQTACDQFVWDLNGVAYTASTNEPVVTLTAANQFGCDSVVTLNLTVNYKSYYEDFHQVCDATSYTWLDGETYNLDVAIADGIEFKTGVNEFGCDNIAQLNLDLNYVLDTLNWVNVSECDDYYIDTVACDGATGRKYINESGDYEVRTRNAVTGRDQITRIHVTINHSEHQTVRATACVPYNWEVNDDITIEGINPVLSNDTVISQELETAAGCPLIKVLRFTALRPTEKVTPVTLCQNGSWTDGNDVVYQMADYQVGENEPVVWNITTNEAGCDSTDYVVFTVNPVYVDTSNLTYCETDFTNGTLTYANPNDITQTATLTIPTEGLNQEVYTNTVTALWSTKAGCDSTVTINYTVNPTIVEDTAIQSCYSYTWEDGNGETYTVSGDYTWDTVNEAGCMRIVTMHLTISDTISDTLLLQACGEYEYPEGSGILYREDMTFVVDTVEALSGCAQINYVSYHVTPRVIKDVYVVANAPYTWDNGETYNNAVNGVYYDATKPGSCDSILVLHLTMEQPITLCENSLPYTTTYGVTLPDENPVFSTDFENGLEGMGNTGWSTVSDVASLTHDGGMFAMTSKTTAPTNNLVMPAIKVSAGSELTFDAAGLHQSVTAPEPTNMVVKVSTDGVNYDVLDEEELTSRVWESFAISLEQYAGQTIYLAFERLDGSDVAMCIDNVTVTGKVDNVLTEEIDDTLFVINYTVNYNTSEIVTVEACDSYTWTTGNGETYTESDMITFDTVNVNGCDSTVILDLTVNYHSDSVLTIANCDSYTWSGIEFTESIDTTIVGLTNEVGCDSTATLHLTINVNAGTADTVVACDSYKWQWAEDTIFLSGNYSADYTDLNECQGVHTLNLTVNVSTENDLDTIVNASSTYYNGTYYADINDANEGQPYEFDVLMQGANAKGCDSVDHVTLYVTRGEVIDENYNICGNFTWERNGHTYTWIDAAERAANGNALYKDTTDNVYIHSGENPIAVVTNAMGVPTNTYVLWLNMVEANYMTIDLGTILLSQHQSTYTVGNDTLDTRTLDLSEYYAAKQNVPDYSDTIHHTSTYYCENVVTYTANLVWNYDTLDTVYVCNGVSTYDWTIGNDTFNETLTGDTTTFTETFAEGTANEMVNTITIVRNPAIVVVDTTAVACDEFTWYGTKYTASGSYTHNFEVDSNGILCDSLVTLTLTINSSNTGDTTAVVCDSLNWYEHTNITASVDTLTHVFANANAVGCDSTVTLHLTINTNAGSTLDRVACDEFVWSVNDSVYDEGSSTWVIGTPITNTYTGTEASGTKTVQYHDANGCVGTATLNLIINHNAGIDDTVATCLTYTWTVQNRNDINGQMEDITNIYTGAADSGVKTLQFNDVNGCEGTATLNLTIYDTVNTASEDTVYGSGYTFHGHFYTPALNGGDSTYVIIYDTVDAHNCAIKDTLTLHVSQYVYTYINKAECGSYTWTAAEHGNGHTYRVLTAEEAEANQTAAFFDVTANAAVSNMQQNTENGNIYVLNLTLNEPAITEHNYTVLMSVLADANYSYAVEGTTITIDCNEVATATADATVVFDDEHGQGVSCNDIDRYIVSVVYNYVTDDPVTVCYQNAYTLPNNSTEAITIGAANTLVYDIMGQEHVERHTVVVTNNDYTPAAPQVVEVCDTYTWTAGNGETYTASTTANWNDDVNCTAETLQLTINNHIDADVNVTICDTYTWVDNDNAVYTESGDYTRDITDVNECAATETLHLTINVNAGVEETVAACDSYSWTYAAEPLTESNTYTETFTDGNGCVGTATLNLTINAHQDAELTDDACVTYTWADNNNAEYTESGDYTRSITDANGCAATETLHLTINQPESEDVEFWFGDGSYRYTGIFTTATGRMYMPGDYTGITEIVPGVTANGCDSIYNITLHVGNYRTMTEAKRSCNSYTWERNGVTYVRLTDAESEANPTALYKTQAGVMVYANPTDTVEVANNYDSIYMLDLTLDATTERDTVINFPISLGVLTYAGQTYDFSVAEDAAREYENTVYNDTIHIAAVQYCDSIINLTVNVINNYNHVDADGDICMSDTSYTWNNITISTVNDNYDVEKTWYIYDTVENADSLLTVVNWVAVVQHPYAYITERRTECDSYNWNGTVFTESTSGATMTLHDQYGCDSTVTLTLTINHTTSSAMGSEAAPIVACDGYEWILSNNEAVSPKYTESGVYTMDYTSVEGCPSTDTLYLTINNSTETTVEAEGCGNYTWMNGDETVGTYTASGTYTHTFEGANAAGCDSTVTLNLTVYEIPATVYDAPDAHVCDTFFWIGQTWNGTEMVDTVFDTITETAYSLTALAYNENGCPIEHFISAIFIDKSSGRTEAVACDSYEWHGTEYTESGAYEYVNPTTNACGNPVDSLYLTINKNSGHMDEVAICNSNLPAAGYEWNGSYYSTTGEYYYNYSDDNQCASTDTLKLTVGNVRTFARIDTTYCGPFTWDITGETFEESTNVSYIMTGANAGGCDSVVYLYLTIYEQPVVAATDVICDNALENYSWRGINIDAAGEYTDFGGAANEYCDSLYTLALTVNERTYSSTDITACDSYEWNGTVYTESGDYNYTTSNAAGCDSVATLHLTINANSGHVVSEAVCDSYEWHGVTYTESGEYYYNYSDANNCASVDTLQLVIANSEDNTIEETACDNYTWVVNEDTIGTYTESGIYQHSYTTTDGCDGILNLNLTVNYSNSGEENAEACDTYEWNEETYTETGVYTFQTTNVAGCDSIVTLNLTIKASTESEENATACNFYTWNNTTYTESGDYTYNTQNAAGCDSTATLHLTVNSSDAVTLSDTACDSYSWNGANYTQSGAYTYATTNVAGCDSIVTLNLTVNYSTAATVEATACDTYEWTEGNGQTYTESGNYNYTTTAANGCDSVVTLALTINNSNSETIEMAACDSYEWNGELYNQSGQYTYQTTNVAGCDSVVTLNLTINTATVGSEDTTVCDSYAWNGETYEQSGVYTYTTTNAAGCDSVVTLTLTVNYSTTETLDTAVCGSFTWTDGDGETYSTTGIHTFNTTNAEGCNLVKTLFLTINQPITTTVHQTVCDSYEWNNETYNATGNYTYTTTAANGCDSIVTLALTVNNSTVGSVTDTACDSYSWNGTIYTESNTYTYNTTNVAGCDSTVTLNLTINNSSSSDTIVASCGSYIWNNVVYSQSGNYSYTTTNAVGCDSVANLFLTVNHGTIADPITVEACLSYTWNGNVYTQSGVYYDTTANNQGCDNVAALILTIKQPYTTTVHQTACDSYEWNNVTYTVSGNYVDTLTAGNSCDSIVTLALTVNESKTGSFEASVCNEQFYIWNGQNYNAAGPYTQVLTARNGCDSTVTMNLTVLQPINVVDTQTACVSFTWGVNNANYTASGDYTANIIDANNCAATASLNLTVNQPINSTIDTTVCVSCTWNGAEYTETGAYTRDITDANGCAAIETLNLTINVDVPDVQTVTACDSYTWVVNDEIIGTYTETPGYQLGTTTTGENGCPHAVYLMLTVNHSDTTVTDVTAVGSYEWHGTEYTESGTYTFIGTTFGGCDSVMILNLTVNPPINYFDVTLTSSNVAMGSVSTINGTDTVMVEGTMSIAENSIVNAIAISNPGYKFVGWTEGDDIVSTDSIYSFIVTSDVNLVANFEYIPIYYTVSTQVVTVMHDGNIDTVYGQHGQVIGEGEYESGSTVTLTAVADSGFHFVCWSNGRNTATITFTVTDDINLIAYFEQDALPEAIDETDMSDVTIFSVDTKIIVRGAEGYDVYVFDVNGRTISRQLNAADEVEFRMASTGVYLVKVGNAPAKRVLVVR